MAATTRARKGRRERSRRTSRSSVARRLKAALEARLGVRVLLTRDGDQAVASGPARGAGQQQQGGSVHQPARERVAAAGRRGRRSLLPEPRRLRRTGAARVAGERRRAAGPRRRQPRDRDHAVGTGAGAPYRSVRRASRRPIEGALRERVPMSPRALQQAPFRVLVGANMPAVLVELGFLTNAAAGAAARRRRAPERARPGARRGHRPLSRSRRGHAMMPRRNLAVAAIVVFAAVAGVGPLRRPAALVCRAHARRRRPRPGPRPRRAVARSGRSPRRSTTSATTGWRWRRCSARCRSARRSSNRRAPSSRRRSPRGAAARLRDSGRRRSCATCSSPSAATRSSISPASIVAKHPGGSLDEIFTVYTLVNALTVNLPAVTRVQILVDGKEVDTLAGHVDLRHPLSKSMEWVVHDTH